MQGRTLLLVAALYSSRTTPSVFGLTRTHLFVSGSSASHFVFLALLPAFEAMRQSSRLVLYPVLLLFSWSLSATASTNLSTLAIPSEGTASLTHYDLPPTAIAACGCSNTSSEYPTAALNQAAYGSTISCTPTSEARERTALTSLFDSWTSMRALLQPIHRFGMENYTSFRSARGEPNVHRC